MSWTGVPAVQNGLPDAVRKQRTILFGQNLIDVEGKSVLSLLIDEVIYFIQSEELIYLKVDDCRSFIRFMYFK